jgi:hypothetical protein
MCIVKTEVETILHVLIDCPIAVALWINLVPLEASYCFFSADLMRWVELNMANSC